jgi:hypothetical protein
VTFVGSIVVNTVEGRIEGTVTIPVAATAATGTVTLRVGSLFATQIPVPAGFNQTIILPFAAAVVGLGSTTITVTSSASVTLGTPLALSYRAY